MIDTKNNEDLETLLEYLEQEAKLMATSQPDQKSLHKVGIYPVDVDSGDTPGSGCYLGCSQLHGLALWV